MNYFVIELNARVGYPICVADHRLASLAKPACDIISGDLYIGNLQDAELLQDSVAG